MGGGGGGALKVNRGYGRKGGKGWRVSHHKIQDLRKGGKKIEEGV